MKDKMRKIIEVMRAMMDKMPDGDKSMMAETVTVAESVMAEMDKADAESVLKAKLAAGEVVLKADADKAVADATTKAAAEATTTTEKKLRDEMAERDRVAGVKASRLKTLTEAGIAFAEDPTKDSPAIRVIRKSVEAIGYAAEDDKKFTDELTQTWKPLVASIRASAEGEEEHEAPPTGSGSGQYSAEGDQARIPSSMLI